MSRPDSDAVHPHGRTVRLFAALTATISLFVAVGGGYAFVRYVQAGDVNVGDTPFQEPGSTDPDGSPSLAATGPCIDDVCNFLILGSDSRAGLTPEEQARFGTNADIGGESRADTIMLVHTDPNLEKAIILSFPRDLWVHIPGHGMGKINGAFEGGIEGDGPKRMADTVHELTGLVVNHYLYVDLNGFQDIVNTLDGVDLCIPAYEVNTPGWLTQSTATGERQVYYSEPGHVVDPNTGLDVLPGCQHLDGFQALAYVRTRHLPCDEAAPDFFRIGRQQQFLRSVINRMLQPSEFFRAPSLVQPILESMHRDPELDIADLVYLVGQLRGITTGAAEFRAVPGTAATIYPAGYPNGLSVVQMDPSARAIFQAIRDGKPIEGVGIQLANTPKSPANIVVPVVDADSGGKAQDVLTVLSDSGFDVKDQIVSPESVGLSGRADSIIAFKPGYEVDAQVVQKYFPQLKMFPVTGMHGANVAVIATSTYQPADENAGGAAATECVDVTP